MSVTLMKAIFSLALYAAAYILLLKFAGWQVTLAVFFLHWGINLGESLRENGSETDRREKFLRDAIWASDVLAKWKSTREKV